MGRGWVTPSTIGLIPMVFIVLFGLINNISADIRVQPTNSPAVSFFFKILKKMNAFLSQNFIIMIFVYYFRRILI